jgi:hypothetical protein
MADWAYDISAALEGAQLVTKQAFSQRSDATAAEKDRAREAILFANAEARYLLDGADFYTGLLGHVTANPIPVDANAAHLLPQLIPAQLATAEIFTEGIRPRANELRDGLLFDPRLVAYINVLRETKTAWEARQRKKEIDAAAPNTPAVATKLNAASTGNVGFDPGNTYAPPRQQLLPSATTKKLSDAAACLIWANNDCEIATLDEKYLHLSGTVDPATHQWRVKDRARLDALLQSAEGGARWGSCGCRATMPRTWRRCGTIGVAPCSEICAGSSPTRARPSRSISPPARKMKRSRRRKPMRPRPRRRTKTKPPRRKNLMLSM